MNILFIHEVDWLNKVVFEIHNLAELLSVRGHAVYAIDYEDKWKNNGYREMVSLKTKEFNGISRALLGSSVSLRRPGIIRIPGISRLSAGFSHWLEIKKTIREKDIDVIMLYSVPTNGLQTIYLARKAGIPVIFRSIDILHRLVPYPLLRPSTRYLEKKVYAAADAILTITPNHSRYVISLGADKDKVHLLPLPIDTGKFHPEIDSSEMRQKWGFGDKDRVLVFIGTLFEFSGLDGCILRFHRIVEKIPEAKLLIVGDGPQRPELERIITELGMEERITITGFQPYQTMPQYINLATLCINPFLDTEATRDIFPGKIIQYIACGRAAVVTPLLGIKALIPDDSQGVIYAGNADEMADKVIELLESEERRRQIEQSGLNYVRQVHDQQKIADQLEAELAEIVKKKPGRLARSNQN
ncbi:MAG: glycosyltransferase family 4 protein [Dehalococcoidales bacterium]